MPIGAFAHIFKEMVKRMTPAIANFNTSAAVPSVMCESRIIAPGDHRLPRGVSTAGTRLATVMPVAGGGVHFKTTARLGVAVLKRIATDWQFIPAIAKAKPVRFTIHYASVTDDG